VSRVLLHVGTPKTGTSFLQDVLFRNRESLREQGILYPADRFDEHFLAALDLLELRWGGLEAGAVGAWDRLAERVRDWPGTAIVSHEILATASRAQAARALGSFGDTEVHLVLSARDLARQIPAEWQENVKHRRTVGYHDFLEKITAPERSGELAAWFWGAQEVPDILERWGARLPADRIHVVTVPPRDAPRDLLWQRFAGVFGLDLATLHPSSERFNPSLGVPETALVRRINERVNHGVLPNEDYRQFVRELLAHGTLSQRSGTSRIGLPDDVRRWAAELSESWVEALSAKGYDVVGDLAELRPGPADAAYVDPDEPDETLVADAALTSIVALLKESARLSHVERDLRQELVATQAALERGERLMFRFKRRLVAAAETNRAAAVGLRAYRWMRDSSSRSA
jgi:hypothetical protein